MGSRPAFTPSTKPSIMVAELTQAIMLLIAFTVLPAPAGPTWKTFGPIALSTGSARVSAALSPPTMMASVAARAPVTPPHRGLQEVHAPRLGPGLDLPG